MKVATQELKQHTLIVSAEISNYNQFYSFKNCCPSFSLRIVLNQLVSSLLSTWPNQRKRLFCITSVIGCLPKRVLHSSHVSDNIFSSNGMEIWGGEQRKIWQHQWTPQPECNGCSVLHKTSSPCLRWSVPPIKRTHQQHWQFPNVSPNNGSRRQRKRKIAWRSLLSCQGPPQTNRKFLDFKFIFSLIIGMTGVDKNCLVDYRSTILFEFLRVRFKMKIWRSYHVLCTELKTVSFVLRFQRYK